MDDVDNDDVSNSFLPPPDDSSLEDGTQFEIGEHDIESESDEENTRPIQTAPVGEKVTFHHIKERALELASAVQNDKPLLKTLLCNLNAMIDRVRSGRDIQIHFGSGLLNDLTRDENVNTNVPRSAVSKACTNSSKVKHKQSGREYNSRQRR